MECFRKYFHFPDVFYFATDSLSWFKSSLVFGRGDLFYFPQNVVFINYACFSEFVINLYLYYCGHENMN